MKECSNRHNGVVVRIGVVADTHCPEFLDELPSRLLQRLHGVDLIIHAGDVGGEATLARLRTIAPVEAVRGDHDRHLPHLPPGRELSVEGRTIAVVHGNRSRLIEEPVTLLGTLSLGRAWPDAGIQGWLCRRFPEADVIVYGHTHRARVQVVGGKLLFNPGAVYMVDGAEARRRLDRGPNWFEWCWLQVIRHRRDRPVPSFGLLEIGDRVRARVYPLR
ncbi:MAG TPA: metallophosphoesterase family protein [Candidatus Dormibacteraeota bacterium]|nr:metallophosphoesterase family protein [Candidatus Dormibacteraeota bacterium]